MSVVKSVEYLEVDLGTSTLSQTDLTKGQDETACTPFMTIRSDAANNDNYAHMLVDVSFDDNAGTARLNLERKTGTDGITVQIFVVEWDTTKVNVQQGTISIADTATTGTASITAVTLSKAFAIHTMREGMTQSADPNGTDDYLSELVFNSTTQLGATRDNVSGDLTGHYYVVECIGTEFSVQTATPALTASGTSGDDTITAVVAAKTFLVTSMLPLEGGPGSRDMAAWAHLSSTTNVNLSRDGGGGISGAISSTIFAVECANTEWSVERFQPNFATSETTDNTAITSVDTARSAIVPGTYSNMSTAHVNDTLNRDDYQVGLDLSTATNARARRLATGSLAAHYKFEVVEFEVSSGTSVAVGQAVETDAALAVVPVAGAVTVNVGIAVETDTALPITIPGIQTVAVGQAQETDTALPVSVLPGVLAIPVDIAVETDTALSITVKGGAVWTGIPGQNTPWAEQAGAAGVWSKEADPPGVWTKQ